MKTKYFYAVLLLICAFFFGCKKQNEIIEIVDTELPETVKTHKWYYFSQDGFSQIDNIKSIPRVLEKPWTESVRISKALTFNNTAYFAVNRKGLLICKNDEIAFNQDENLFSDNTMGTFLVYNELPILHVYKNSLFNNTKTQNNSVLIQYNPATGLFYPLLQKKDLSLENTEEVVSASFIDNSFVFSTKNSSLNSSEFKYYSLPLEEEGYLNLSATDFITQEFSAADFRQTLEPKSFSLAPNRIKTLLKVIPEDFSFMLHLQNQDGSVTEYLQQKNLDSDPQEAYGYLGESFVVALFPDGTFYFAGAAEGKHILKNGEAISMRLPKLPKGYKYTSFGISGTKLYCGFEEYNFYKTGISGFLEVNLEETLYK